MGVSLCAERMIIISMKSNTRYLVFTVLCICLLTDYLHRVRHYQQHLHYGPPAHALSTAGQKPSAHLIFSVVEVSNRIVLKTVPVESHSTFIAARQTT